MSLNEHAEFELRRAGLLDEDSDYNGMVGRAVLDIVNKFSTQGHSGMSARMTVEILGRLLRYEPLTPLTSDPSEWNKIAEEMSGGEDLWQSRRRSSTFSRDGGQTWYDTEDPSLNNGDVWQRPQWRPYYLGDESVRPGARMRVRPDAYTAGSGLEVNGKEGTFGGARNGFVYITYDDTRVHAAHRAQFVEVWIG